MASYYQCGSCMFASATMEDMLSHTCYGQSDQGYCSIMNPTAAFSVVLLLFSTEICKGVHYKNATKRMTNQEICACNDVNLSYKTITLYDYLYEYPFKCIPPGWEYFFNHIMKDIIRELSPSLQKLAGETGKIEPHMGYLFEAFRKVPRSDVKVVIVGDPTTFNLSPNVKVRQGSKTAEMFKTLIDEGYVVDYDNSDLSMWAAQGVLLLNHPFTIITLGSYENANKLQEMWSDFTQKLLKQLITSTPVWILLGDEAKQLEKFIYPFPYSFRPVVTVKPFFKCANEWLQKRKMRPINWNLALKEDIDEEMLNCKMP